MRTLHALRPLAALLLALPALAGADTLSLKLENDVLATDSDGHYTNGLALTYGFEPEPEHWAQRLSAVLPGWSPAQLDSVAYRFGHQLYTPEDIERAVLIEDDRPYAALMFAGVSLFAEAQHAGWRSARGLHLDVGMVGPAAGGEKIQRGVHRLTGSDEPKGWDHQLENEAFVNLAYQHRWWLQQRLGPLELEYGPSAGGALGNLYTYASAGLGARLGDNLGRSFSLPAVAPAQGGSQFFTPSDAFGWYVYANLDGRYTAHNLLLDGNTFEDSHSVDKRHWVGDAQVGLAMTWAHWQVSLTHVWRTREFETQREHDQFASLTLSTWL